MRAKKSERYPDSTVGHLSTSPFTASH